MSLLSLRDRHGPFTDELRRVPGPFGLGQVPAQLQPTAVANSICGYCSTGCQLKIHLRDGEPVNLTADPRYPVNLGMGCPKGWEALTPLAASDRATTPLLEGAPISWELAANTFSTRMKAILADHGPEAVAFLSTGQICTERNGIPRSFRQIWHGPHSRRWQHAPVHGNFRRRLQGILRL